MPYQLERRKRKSLAIQVHPGGLIKVLAPLRMPLASIHQVMESKKPWILAQHQRLRAQQYAFSQEEEQALRARAQAELPGLLAHYSQALGLFPKGLRITGAKTRFGSCSSKGKLCFSWRLFAYPLAAIEYVVVHELCHLVHLNHSPAFYALLKSHLPDYQERAALLLQGPIKKEKEA